uniref:Nudix hydrolase domain-containing protein n=1 Tax=Lactuca sativa TaxID=4236 RepID=A0A9R1VS46_LACSA|nr:hypothetical protein LSAT_V11C400162920 [Lactuca sativa]
MWSLWFCIGSGEDCVIEYLISYKLLNHSSLIGFGPDKTYLILIFPVLYIIDFIFLNERYIHFSYLQVFVASRLNVPGAWQMPQGGIEEGEEPTSAAVRELREETGVVSAEIIAEVPKWLTYDFPPAVKAKVNRLWGGGEWHGQAQKW